MEERLKEHEPAPPEVSGPIGSGKLIAEMWPAYLIEIVVIILGITISLVLEEWRDHRKERQLETIYERNLLADISVDQRALEVVTDSTEVLIKRGNDLLSHPTSATLYADLRSLLARPDFLSGDATFSDLKNSGNLRLLHDIALKNLLFSYYSLVQNLKEAQDAERQATIILSGAYFLKRFPLSETAARQMSPKEMQELSGDTEFVNNVLPPRQNPEGVDRKTINEPYRRPVN